MINREDSIFLVFNKNNEVVCNSHGQPRVYVSKESFLKYFPDKEKRRNYSLVEFKEVKN